MRQPITTLEELDALDPVEMVEGYWEGYAGEQASGEAIVKMVAGDKRVKEGDADGMTAYFGQLAQGWSHEEVVDKMGKWAQESMKKAEQDRQFRTGESEDM